MLSYFCKLYGMWTRFYLYFFLTFGVETNRVALLYSLMFHCCLFDLKKGKQNKWTALFLFFFLILWITINQEMVCNTFLSCSCSVSRNAAEGCVCGSSKLPLADSDSVQVISVGIFNQLLHKINSILYLHKNARINPDLLLNGNAEIYRPIVAL